MGKTHRGRGIRGLLAHGVGVCPRCKTSGIKVLYEKEIDGKQLKLCKFCNAALRNISRKEARKAKAAAPKETVAKEEAKEAAV